MVTLRKGSKGADVKTLQTKLNSLGFNCGIADGDFGTKTYNAVIAFQHINLTDGVVGPLTWERLAASSSFPSKYYWNFTKGAILKLKAH